MFEKPASYLIEMLISFVSFMVSHRNDFLIVSIVLLVKNLQTEATHSLFWLFRRGKRLKWEWDVHITVLSSAAAFCARRGVMRNEHHCFGCCLCEVWPTGGVSRGGLLWELTLGVGEGGSWTSPAWSWTLSRKTQSGVCVMNADSCLSWNNGVL